MAVTRLARSAYYSSSIETFSVEEAANVIGQLSLGSEFPVEPSQRDAWNAEIEILKDSLMGLPGTVFFEYVVPRIGSRIDAVVITGSAVVVIEFKIGASRFTRADENQLWDYALDLKNFHQGSHDASIFPILVATEANDEPPILSEPHHDSVYSPMRATPGSLRKLFEAIYQRAQQGTLNPEIWSKSPYQPTPTIIQAAQALYANHSVDAITRNDAGRENLSHTSQSVEEIVEQTRQTGGRSIVFITGVPGAGKTLVGLNIATKRREIGSPAHAVYLSGNGPLVKVLCEALTRDEVSSLKALGKRKTKVEVGQPIKSFIQNVHHFRDAGLRDAAAPSDHVVIFDEAQRAWNREMTSDFMRRKKGQPDFDSSEPEFLISYLDRHRDWAVIICLVGGGQEINRGEAGISAWFDAVREKFPHWQVYAPSALLGAEYGAASALKSLQGRHNLNLRSGLHILSVRPGAHWPVRHASNITGVAPGKICRHNQGCDLTGRTCGCLYGLRDQSTNFAAVIHLANMPGHSACKRRHIRAQRSIHRLMRRRMITHNIYNGRARLARIVKIRERVTESWPKVQQRCCRLAGHARITIRCARTNTLKQTQHGAHSTDAIQRSHELHFRRSGVHETHVHPVLQKRPQQTLRSGHFHFWIILATLPPRFSLGRALNDWTGISVRAGKAGSHLTAHPYRQFLRC